MVARSGASPAASAARCVRVTARPRSTLARSSSIRRPSVRTSPPPPGASSILGLECAGEVMEVGPDVRGLAPGRRVMALLAGGGYAEEAVVDAGSVLLVPDGMTDEEAGGFPEVFLTAFSNLFMPRLGHLAPG